MYPTAYVDGYLAACASLPRLVPADLVGSCPDQSPVWLRGYDDAGCDNKEMRAIMVEGFGTRLVA